MRLNSLNKQLLLFLAINFTSTILFSQNINRPYSVYGIGDVDKGVYNRTSGMAGTGLAIKSSVFLIDNNPAALSGLAKSFYVAQLSGSGKTYTYSGEPITTDNANSKDFGIKRFSLAVKVNNFWASGIGLNQFSNVNYKLNGSQFVEGTTESYSTLYEGDGGLNEYYWTNALSLGKHFSIGIKSSYIAGSLNQAETVSEADIQSTITTTQQDYIGNFRFQTGAMYETALGKKWNLSIGGKYIPKTKLSAERTLTVTENNVDVFTDKYIRTNRFYLPVTYAAGIALKHNRKTTFAADYTYEDWSSLNIKDKGWQLLSSQRVSAGVEFSSFKNDRGFLSEKRFVQFGVFADQSYLQIRNTPIREWGVSAGIGGSVKNSFLYSLSVEGGVRGTTAEKLIKETYVGLTFSLSYRDFLFSKGRLYD